MDLFITIIHLTDNLKPRLSRTGIGEGIGTLNFNTWKGNTNDNLHLGFKSGIRTAAKNCSWSKITKSRS